MGSNNISYLFRSLLYRVISHRAALSGSSNCSSLIIMGEQVMTFLYTLRGTTISDNLRIRLEQVGYVGLPVSEQAGPHAGGFVETHVGGTIL